MKYACPIILFLFIGFLFTPTIILVVEKEKKTSKYYELSEEEKDSFQEVKGICNTLRESVSHKNTNYNLQVNVIYNLSYKGRISFSIIVPPPDVI
jgi:hypothetical protein